jgi:hypothetical protein
MARLVAVSESTGVDSNAVGLMVFAEWGHARLEHEGAGWPAYAEIQGLKVLYLGALVLVEHLER